MEGITMPFNWPKCGPALSPSTKLRPSNIEISHLRRARVMLSQSLACLERENIVQDSDISPPKLDVQRLELSLITRQEGMGGQVAQNPEDALVDASGSVAPEHEMCRERVCDTPSSPSVAGEGFRPSRETGKNELLDPPISACAGVLESPSEAEEFVVAEAKNLPLENSSIILVDPERPETGATPSNNPQTKWFRALNSKSGNHLVSCGVRGSCKLFSEPGPSILRRLASTMPGSSSNLDRVKETEEGSDEDDVKGDSSLSPEDYKQIVLVETASALGEGNGQRAQDYAKQHRVAEAGSCEQKEGRENRVSAGVGEGTTKAETKSRIEKRTRRRDLRFQELTHGRFLEGRLVYRQTFVVRSYEVGLDKIASVDTLTNLFQEVALNHVWLLGISGDGFGATRAMNTHRLICVVTRMHVEVERYPSWNELVSIDSWFAPEGKHGLRRDWLVHDHKYGQVLARATSTWVMMNKDTRRISKVPKDVRAEFTPFFVDRAVIAETPKRLNKLGETAQFIQSGLRASRRDMDANQHVNSVKYIDWIMESVPQPIFATHELSSVTMEYRHGWCENSIVESLTEPETQHSSSEYTLVINVQGSGLVNISPVGQNKQFTYSSGPLTLNGAKTSPSLVPLQYTHMLRTVGNGDELLRARTTWRLRKRELCPTPSCSINA